VTPFDETAEPRSGKELSEGITVRLGAPYRSVLLAVEKM
jgi:hypothetical protein